MPIGLYTGPDVSIANGSTTVFPYTFKIFAAADLKVYVDDVLQSTGYSIDGVGEGNGGDVTFVNPPAAGSVVTRNREAEFKRDTDYQRNGSFESDAVDDDFDRAIMLTQQVNATLDRAIKAPVSETSTSLVLPPVDERANKFLAFASDGSIIATTGEIENIPVSEAMTPVVQAETLAEGRELLGLGALPPTQSVRPVTFDMQGKVLKAPWNTGEFGGMSTFPIAAGGAAAGATSLTINVSGPVPVSDQLLVYLGTDGEYYTVAAGTVVGTTVSLRSPLEVAVSAGATCFAFWSDNYHPNVYGYRAIVDEFLRDERKSLLKIADIIPEALNTGTIAVVNSNDAFLPCSTDVDAYQVTPGGVNGGVTFSHTFKKSGYYIGRIKINTGAADLNVQGVFGGRGVINLSTYRKTDSSVLEFPIFVPYKASTALVLNLFRTATDFTTSSFEIYEYLGEGVPQLNNKNIVVLGDSWVAFDYINERLQERLPAATIYNEGVGGNRASDMLTRFANDVATHAPDVVLIIAGTNDVAAAYATAADVYGADVAQLKFECQKIGAVPVFFTPYLASPGVSTAEYNRSRKYVAECLLYEEEIDLPDTMVVPITGFVANGQSLKWPLGRYKRSIRVHESYVTVALAVKYDGSLPAGTTTSESPLASGFQQNEDFTLIDAARFVELSYTNGTGSDKYVEGYVIVDRPLLP